jgi:hypothetical protein
MNPRMMFLYFAEGINAVCPPLFKDNYNESYLQNNPGNDADNTDLIDLIRLTKKAKLLVHIPDDFTGKFRTF